MTFSYVLVVTLEIETKGTQSSWSGQRSFARRHVFIRRRPPRGPDWSDGRQEVNRAETLNSKVASTQLEKRRFVFSFPQ